MNTPLVQNRRTFLTALSSLGAATLPTAHAAFRDFLEIADPFSETHVVSMPILAMPLDQIISVPRPKSALASLETRLTAGFNFNLTATAPAGTTTGLFYQVDGSAEVRRKTTPLWTYNSVRTGAAELAIGGNGGTLQRSIATPTVTGISSFNTSNVNTFVAAQLENGRLPFRVIASGRLVGQVSPPWMITQLQGFLTYTFRVIYHYQPMFQL